MPERLLPLLLLLSFLLPSPARAATKKAPDSATAPVVLAPGTSPAFVAAPASPTQAPTPAMTEAPASLSTAANAQAVLARLKLDLSAEQKAFLDRNHFLLVPKRETAYAGTYDFESCNSPASYDEMLGMFDQVCGAADPMERRPENARFVTPDIVLHALGKYFENALEYLEKTELYPLLRRFVAGLRDRALALRKTATGDLAAHLETVAAQLTIPLVLLDNATVIKIPEVEPQKPVKHKPDTGDTEQAAQAKLTKLTTDFSPQTVAKLREELKRIYAADAVEVSPLFGGYAPDSGLKADYSQYRPRGHYAKSSQLRAYFRAMLYLGRNGWPLSSPDGLSDALLVTLLTASPGQDGKPLVAAWRRIMDLTGFFAGLPDDLTYPDLRNFTTKVLGRDSLSPAEAVSPAVRDTLAARLDELPAPRILSEVLVSPEVADKTKEALLAQTKSFRLFGQRFSPDAWVFSRLTAGQEKTDLRLPSMPTALFVPAALGNKPARDFTAVFLAQGGQAFTPEQVAAFLGRLDATAARLAALPEADWNASLASAWLHVLATLKSTYGQGWPAYMQSPPFPAKQIESVLGSYTELKHATILYAKPNYAEFGDGGEEGTPPPVPKGFVEPNPAFWSALLTLVDTAKAGFARYKVLATELEEYGRLEMFRKHVAQFAALADKELTNTPISEADYETLRLSGLSYMGQPFEPVVIEPDQCKSALTADIHTDVPAGQVLYEGTAEPYVMLALVGNEASPRLVVGTAFNHYEFTRPLAEGRLTDEAWRAGVYASPPKLPAKNDWYEGLLVK